MLSRKKLTKNGTIVWFNPDEEILGDYEFIPNYIEKQIWNYAYLIAVYLYN